MATYRAYMMDAEGHYIDRHLLAGCETDAQALHSAETYAIGIAVQVWNLDRLVGTLSPVDDQIVSRLGS